MTAFIDEQQGDAAMAEFALPLAKASRSCSRRPPGATAAAAARRRRRPRPATICDLFGLVALAYMWARMAESRSQSSPAGRGRRVLPGKLATARFFMLRVLPETVGLGEAIRSGSAPLVASDAL